MLLKTQILRDSGGSMKKCLQLTHEDLIWDPQSPCKNHSLGPHLSPQYWGGAPESLGPASLSKTVSSSSGDLCQK